MANLEQLKDIVDEQLESLTVSEELKQKTLMKCLDKNEPKAKQFRLPIHIVKPLIAVTSVLIITVVFANYSLLMGGSDDYQKASQYEEHRIEEDTPLKYYDYSLDEIVPNQAPYTDKYKHSDETESEDDKKDTETEEDEKVYFDKSGTE